MPPTELAEGDLPSTADRPGADAANVVAMVTTTLVNAVLLWLSDHAIRAALRLPAMWFEGRCTHPWLGEAALVGLLALLLAGYALGWRRRYGGFWMPFVYVALVLLLGAKFI